MAEECGGRGRWKDGIRRGGEVVGRRGRREGGGGGMSSWVDRAEVTLEEERGGWIFLNDGHKWTVMEWIDRMVGGCGSESLMRVMEERLNV